MKQSQLFTKTRKEAPSDEVSKNAQLLIRAGFIHKEMAGVYTYLPMGLRVLKKIKQIIREEMNAIDGQEMLMTTLQDPEIWKKSNRWTDEGEENPTGLPWFKTQLTNGQDLGIANTHEEALANIMQNHIKSYKDLPKYAYQFQNKFRNELRAKSGIMRCREFIMKDLYSFTRTEENLENYYERSAEAYLKIFERVGLKNKTYRCFASGGAFSKFSDEFQTLSESGEDTIYIDEEKKIAVNKEVYTDEILTELGLDKNKLVEKKSIEVGNIFKLGTQYAEAEGLMFTDENGIEKPVIMGSYGIGLGRLLGTIVEVHNDNKGIIWPESVAPYSVHLISLCREDADIAQADVLYKKLTDQGVDVLYDDRQGVRPGEKFADSDLMGIPKRIIISPKTLEQDSVEVKMRNADKIMMENIKTF